MRFIWFHALFNFLSPVDTSWGGLHIFLSLFSAALLGFGRRDSFSSHKVYACLLERLSSAHWVVVFYKMYSNTLYIFLRWILIHVWSGQYLEGSALFLRAILFLNVSDVFGGGSKFSGQFFNRSNAIWLVCPIWSPRGPLLSPGLRLSDRFSGGASAGSCSSLSFRFSMGVYKFLGRTALILYVVSW